MKNEKEEPSEQRPRLSSEDLERLCDYFETLKSGDPKQYETALQEFVIHMLKQRARFPEELSDDEFEIYGRLILNANFPHTHENYIKVEKYLLENDWQGFKERV
ncbi:MAG: hypothetical protein PVJ08_04065, partial [Dehalococcoidia bacterium]